MIDEGILKTLISRLPELRWQLTHLKKTIQPRDLPRGLFKWPRVDQNDVFLQEIQADVDALKLHLNAEAGIYIAKKLKDKIDVLVKICQLASDKSEASDQAAKFGIEALMTRSKWLKCLEDEINHHQKLKHTLEQQLKDLSRAQPEVILGLKKTLGDVCQKLTQLQETYQRAVRDNAD
jgi:hypothetical protein